jgi:membrane protease YdiL (CAAX protease family)
VSTDTPFPSASPVASRALSAFELLLGAAIVIGHNVFRVVPNEVPILFVLGLFSVRFRDGGWSAMGFKRPASWKRILLIALAAAALRMLTGEIVERIALPFWPAIVSPAGANEITGNIKLALLTLLLVWSFAAFGEEIAYRGYLLTRAADLGNRTTAAYWLSMIVVSVLFGFGHYYKGPTGILDSGIAGLILGAAYLVSGRNLWTSILAHGFVDTFGIIMVFFGWES